MTKDRDDKEPGQDPFMIKEFSVMVKSKKEAEQVQRDMQHATTQNIFRPIKQSKLHDKFVTLLKWLFKKTDRWLGMTSPEMRRYNRVHKFVKNMVVHKALRVINRLLGRYVIKDIESISCDWWNNHMRMFYQCWEDSVDDIFIKAAYPVTVARHIQRGETQKPLIEYMDFVCNNRSHQSRMLLMRLWMTEVMEDTADRILMDCLMMRIYWTMHTHYKGNVPKPGEYPIFTNSTKNDPVYFYTNKDTPIWVNKTIEVDEIGKNPRPRTTAEKQEQQTNKTKQDKDKD